MALFLVSLGFQVHSGAWKSDFGAHPDEGAHVVTSLMVRDYLMGGFRENLHPMRYAEAYYELFPKVAIGHYPPLFYVVAAIFLAPFRSPEAMLILMAVLSAVAGWITWIMGRRVIEGDWLALGVAVLFCVLPLVRTYTAIVMADLLLVIFCLLALLSFVRFIETKRLRYSIGFGVLASLAILTKGSGLMLALVPPLSILLLGSWDLLKNWRLWMAAVPVLVLAAPWILLTRHITAEGMSEQSLSDYVGEAFGFYLRGIGAEVGWVTVGLVLIGAVILIFKRFANDSETERMGVDEAVLWSMCVGLPVFFLLIPSGLDHRYLLPMLPLTLILAVMGIKRTLGMWGAKPLEWAPLVILMIAVETWRPVKKVYTGADEVIEEVVTTVASEDGKPRTSVLVISDAKGEGAVISAAAFQAPKIFQMKRGSKVLGTSDWMGRGYKLGFENLDDLQELLGGQAVDFLLIDEPMMNTQVKPEHWEQVLGYLQEDQLKEIGTPIARFDSHRKNQQKSIFHLVRLKSVEINDF